ncbi:MAG: WD40 repeat domain-containing protein [Candidatus Eremiobacteraeota bacterium]|nr:WD40 repeat domain-containing protein [Candidatus Eremiobacteraeota bacterium]
MRARILLFFCLAVLGYGIDQVLVGWLDSPVRKVSEFGQDLVVCATGSQGLTAALGRNANGFFLQVFSGQGDRLFGPVPVEAPVAPLRCLGWREDGQAVAIASGHNVLVLEGPDWQMRRLKTDTLVREVAYRGHYLMARGTGNLHLWQASSLKVYWRLDQPYLLHSDVSRDGRWLATGCFEEGIRIFDLRTRRQALHFEQGLTPAGLDFCHQDQWLAACYRFRGRPNLDHARLYEACSGKPVGPPLEEPGLRGYAVSRDGQKVLIRSQARATVFEPLSGRKLAQNPLDTRVIDSLSPDGRWAATTPPDCRVVVLWDTQNGQVLANLSHPQAPTFIDWWSDRNLTVSGGSAAIWQLRPAGTKL